MDISWEDAQTFLAIAEGKSFSAAARQLGLGQPTISRRIASLEARVGCQLFRRGKRGAELTNEGARLLPSAEQMARWAGEFGRVAQGAEEAIAGVVRIAAPPALAIDILAPMAATVRDRHPRLRVEILASIDHVDLSRGIADLAVRTRPPHEPELTSLEEIAVPMGVFASPGYAATLRAPVAISDLDWITWAFPYEHVFPRPMLERAVAGFEPVFASDSYLAQRSAAAAGVGAMILERASHPDGLDLVEIDVGIELPPGQLHLVCAKSVQYIPRVTAVVEMLRERLRASAP